MSVLIEQSFARVDLFAELESAELAELASRAAIKSYPKNVIVISEGDETSSLYVILSGRVKVFASDEDGKEVLLNWLGVNEYFGEIALIDGGPRSASVMTVEPTRMAVMARDSLIERIHSNPVLAVGLLKTLGKKLRQQTASTKDLALLGVYQRLVKVLRELGREEGGQLVIEGVSHKHLADRVFASREMVTLVFRELKAGGYIDADRKRIVVKKRLPERW